MTQIEQQLARALRQLADAQGTEQWQRAKSHADKLLAAWNDAAEDDARIDAAEKIVLACECDPSANDHNEAALAAAAHNYKLVKHQWHNPKTCDATDQDIAYFRDPNGREHGWMCVQCHCLQQTG
jgi:hypothetical protein